MGAALDLSARINLKRTSVLVLDQNPQALAVMRQVLNGFGVRAVHSCETAKDARRVFRDNALELAIVDPLFVDDSGFEFIRWARREEDNQNRCIAIIAAIGHQTLTNVRAARDAGANVVVAKPLSPEVLLQRIHWVARENRQFIIAQGYAGPDRRFRNDGPPPGTDGRRNDDLSFDVPIAAAPNMDQSEIDEMFKPRKISL
ncbi:Two-component system response regulator [uncultured Defluviicoccus sp.]|uniref:Two-component system response regulator n=1 Tax=metagenome TaxID=256318 RepID=A0A380T7B4_9ZZZZ|nr:Two-component system response regulator [uncultured Defluviicoccus sp.]